MNIYDELRAGASAEELVAAFTAQLNEAEARIKTEDEAEAQRIAEAKAAEERAQAALAKAKREDLADAIAAIADTLAKHYPDLLEGVEVGDDELYAMADLLIVLLDMEALKAGMPKISVKTKPVAKKKAAPEDAFASFFKAFGL